MQLTHTVRKKLLLFAKVPLGYYTDWIGYGE
jgi:hypothetical protein